MTGRRRKPTHQRGVALLAALLVVAVGLLLLAALLQTGDMQRARSGYLLRHEQAWQLARGMEAWGARILREARQRSDGVDSLDDPWLQPIAPVPLPAGQISGRLIDRGGCFNVNSLLRVDGSDDPLAAARLKRLLRAASLPESLLPTLQDWVDPDFSPRASGAEDATYRGRPPGYLAANAPMLDLSELRLLNGVDNATYARLRSLLCALPQDAAINLNTAPIEVWMALDERVTAAMARQLSMDGHARYGGIDAIRAALKRQGVEGVSLEGCSVGTRYFRASILVEADATPYRFGALLRRDKNGVAVLRRWQGD
ncbi:MAG: type II secretion system minor pseudopilin GspK [Xanthomonadales bacterium]|nr:type II secretion system minor pseudopilin GspK [Xanthomonadales bacterium]